MYEQDARSTGGSMATLNDGSGNELENSFYGGHGHAESGAVFLRRDLWDYAGLVEGLMSRGR